MARWIVAKEYLDGDYDVYKICRNKKECKKYISNQPKAKQKEFFYFKDLTYKELDSIINVENKKRGKQNGT